MRLLSVLLPLTLTACAAAKGTTHDDKADAKSDGDKAADIDLTEEAHDTTFNGQTVPPIPMLKGDEFQKQISHGYWLVEAFSPYCHHCKHLAPKWQTLYEFYYTSDPLPASSSNADDHPLNSFSNYYDFRWGKLDCVANADACTDLNIRMFPTIQLYKDGVQMKNMTGDQSMDELMGFVEDALEKIKPGSRPSGGVVLPEVGANGTGLIEGKEKEQAGTGVMVPKKDSKSPTSSKLSDADSKSDATLRASIHDPTKASSPLPASSKNFEQLLPEPYSSSVSSGPPNPLGQSIPLTPDNFTYTVSESLDPWFIKFYAPWCHHCQALAPSWSEMALDMQKRLRVGEVNCDAYRRLCKENKVAYYPTLKLIRGPESVEYTGLRGVQDITTFATSAAEALHGAVHEASLADFEALEKKNDVIFVYFHDHATTTEDFMALERLPLHVLGKARVVKSSDPDLAARFSIVSFPRLLVSKTGLSEQYPPLMPKEMRDVPALTKWMKAHQLPLVPAVAADNARELMSHKLAVLALLDPARPEAWTDAVKEMKAAAVDWSKRTNAEFELSRQGLRDAKAARVEEAEASGDEKKLRDAKLKKVDANKLRKKEVVFATVDTAFWERWVRGTFDSGRGEERILVYDYDRRVYWDSTSSGSAIMPSRASILEALPAITEGRARSKITGSSVTYWPFLVGY
ncbi:MAG: hypothetical protein Q9159_006928, partial [Coniocarpon cinnabarinum]